jgi:hypothetical protein
MKKNEIQTLVNKVVTTRKKVAPNRYSNEDGVEKMKTRHIIVNTINSVKLPKRRFLSLSADNCLTEGMLYNQVSKRSKFVLCENHPETYRQLLLNIVKNKTIVPYAVLSCSIGEEIRRSRENDYTDLVLDYCGQIGTNHEDIEYAIKNNIVCVGGTISVTLSKRISGGVGGGYNMSFIEKMEKLNPNFKKQVGDNRTEPAVLTFFNRICGMNYEIVVNHPYKDTDKQAMMLVIIRRVS